MCLPAYYVERHLRRKLVPVLFEHAEPKRPVELACVSEAAEANAAVKRTPEGSPVPSLRILLENPGTLSLNRVALTRGNPHEFELLTEWTPLQAKALDLLGVEPEWTVSDKLTD